MRLPRREDGFGLIELLIAMTVLNIALLALVAALSSGAVTLRRANRVATASTMADTQMELFRGLKYANIEQTTTGWTAATADSTWTADSVYQTKMQAPVAPVALIPTVSNCPNSVADASGYSCNPSSTRTGPDGRTYRVDTYMYYDTPTGGEQTKVVTVVVRNPNNLSGSLARESSTFDITTGS